MSNRDKSKDQEIIMEPIVQSFISSLVSSFTDEVTTFLEKKLKNWKDVYFNSSAVLKIFSES